VEIWKRILRNNSILDYDEPDKAIGCFAKVKGI
jgi:hypothetical protein